MHIGIFNGAIELGCSFKNLPNQYDIPRLLHTDVHRPASGSVYVGPDMAQSLSHPCNSAPVRG